MTSSVWTGSKTEFWRRDVTYPSGKLVSRQMDGAGRLATVTVDNRDIDFLWTGNIYTGRSHEWAGSATPDPMRHTVTLDGLGRGTHLQFDVLSRDSDGEPSGASHAVVRRVGEDAATRSKAADGGDARASSRRPPKRSSSQAGDTPDELVRCATRLRSNSCQAPIITC